MDIQNTQSQMRKGVLEFCILSISRQGEVYPSDLVEKMKAANLNILEGPDAVAVAEALASTPAPVVIKHLQRVSAPALAALRKKATITLPPDEKLDIVP